MEAKIFPDNISEFDIDPSDTKKCLISGLFREEVDMGGQKRSFYTYLTPGLHYNQSCLIIAPPDDMPVLEFVEKGFWQAFAEREQVFLHFLEPDGAWNLDGRDGDYMNRVYIQVQSRAYYVTMQDNIYGFGFGRGAAVAQQAAMKMTSEWSGLATFGDLGKEALLNAALSHKSESMGAAELAVSGSKAPLPVWMVWKENRGDNEAVCSYWKKQNDAWGEPYSGGGADEIYFPSDVRRKSEVNEEKIAQVRVTNGYTGELREALFNKVWAYVGKARRHRCFGTKALRNYKDPKAYGATLHTMEIGGLTRRWYEYVPKSVAETGEKAPLVLNMHGRGGSAESFMDLSGMSCVAEERGFIVLFPEAGVHQQHPKGIRNVLVWSGVYKGEKIDDTAFLLAMIEDVKSRYSIDETRIYASGQSSGGMMTSRLAVEAPRVFAAVSPWSGVVSPGPGVPLPETMDSQVPYLFLFGENDWLCVDKEKGIMEYRAAENVGRFLEKLMELYRLDRVPKRYRCGEITYYVYLNSDKIPMLTVGTIKNMSHANYPRESWIAYDEFFAKFSKEADGTLLYMGEKVPSI